MAFDDNAYTFEDLIRDYSEPADTSFKPDDFYVTGGFDDNAYTWDDLVNQYSGNQDVMDYAGLTGISSDTSNLGYDLGSGIDPQGGLNDGYGASGIGNILKSFTGSDIGKLLQSGVSLASILAPLLKKQYEGPVDQYGRAVKLESIDKFKPIGSYNPVDFGYGKKGYAMGGPIVNTSIDQLYSDILDRPGEASGKAYWQAQFGNDIDAKEMETFKNAAQAELNARPKATAPSVIVPSTSGGGGSGGGSGGSTVTPGTENVNFGYGTGANTSTPAIRTLYPRMVAAPTTPEGALAQLAAIEQRQAGMWAPRVARAAPQQFAEGGDIPRSDQVQGGLLPMSAQLLESLMSAGGQDDVIDIKAAPGEYVIDAEIVAALGDGNTAAGVRKLDGMRHNIRKHKRGGALSQIAPKAKPIDRYLENK